MHGLTVGGRALWVYDVRAFECPWGFHAEDSRVRAVTDAQRLASAPIVPARRQHVGLSDLI